jgi:hypothetical protein
METSRLKTLANKHKSSVTKLARKYRAAITTSTGVLTCLQAVAARGEGKKPLVAQFGGFSIRRQKDAVLAEQRPPTAYTQGTELLTRLQAETCALCGSTRQVEVHHLRPLADRKRRGRKELPSRRRLMAARQRTPLVTCRACQDDILPFQPAQHAQFLHEERADLPIRRSRRGVQLQHTDREHLARRRGDREQRCEEAKREGDKKHDGAARHGGALKPQEEHFKYEGA